MAFRNYARKNSSRTVSLWNGYNTRIEQYKTLAKVGTDRMRELRSWFNELRAKVITDKNGVERRMYHHQGKPVSADVVKTMVDKKKAEEANIQRKLVRLQLEIDDISKKLRNQGQQVPFFRL